ncbi:MAG: ATP synthase F1 subunit epsilon [Myxococcota bacterium]|nr:ATP synthase F1 subunit epsilon [Myxococcota bacterium]
MSKLQLRMIVPGAQPIEREVDELTLVGSEGVFTILPRHTALLSLLKPGVIRIAVGGKEEKMALGSGVCEVLADRVTVLADRLVEWGDMRASKAVEMVEKAKAELGAISGPSDPHWQDALDDLAWAEACHQTTQSH